MTESWPLEYLRHVVSKLNISPSALAQLAEVSSTTITRPLNSTEHKFEISRRTLDKVKNATGIPYQPFMDGTPANTDAAPPVLPPEQRAMIDVHDVRASAGGGAVVDHEDVIERLSFPMGYLSRLTKSNPRHLKIIGVKGDSMDPTVKDDDVVMLDMSKTNLDFDGLFVLRFGDALHVKRVGRAPGGAVRIISDNDAFPDLDLPRGEVEAVGKVIWIGKRV